MLQSKSKLFNQAVISSNYVEINQQKWNLAVSDLLDTPLHTEIDTPQHTEIQTDLLKLIFAK